MLKETLKRLHTKPVSRIREHLQQNFMAATKAYYDAFIVRL
jgi:hypothetical protein